MHQSEAVRQSPWSRQRISYLWNTPEAQKQSQQEYRLLYQLLPRKGRSRIRHCQQGRPLDHPHYWRWHRSVVLKRTKNSTQRQYSTRLLEHRQLLAPRLLHTSPRTRTKHQPGRDTCRRSSPHCHTPGSNTIHSTRTHPTPDWGSSLPRYPHCSRYCTSRIVTIHPIFCLDLPLVPWPYPSQTSHQCSKTNHPLYSLVLCHPTSWASDHSLWIHPL